MSNQQSLYVPRELEKEIEPFLERREILAIVGARQVGKTTLLQNLYQKLKNYKKVKFLTFEKEAHLKLFENIEDFKDYYQNREVLLIDEFHYAKEGGKKLKYLFDTTPIKFIISGSSSLELTFQTGKFLVGRMLKFYLNSFSFREFLLAKEQPLLKVLTERLPDVFSQTLKRDSFFAAEINRRLEKHFEEYLIFGGYPAVVLAQTQNEKIKILESILENYLLRDIGALLNLKTKEELLKLARFLSTQTANLISYQELSSITNLSYRELLVHLNILENTYLMALLRPFYQNPRTELKKTPKVYFFDNGFRNYLISDFRDFALRNDQGSLVENFVFSHLKRKNLGKLNFWRTKSLAEVDFVWQTEGEIIPLEVKYSKVPSTGKSFYSFLERFSPKKGYILTRGYANIQTIKDANVYFVPAYYL